MTLTHLLLEVKWQCATHSISQWQQLLPPFCGDKTNWILRSTWIISQLNRTFFLIGHVWVTDKLTVRFFMGCMHQFVAGSGLGSPFCLSGLAIYHRNGSFSWGGRYGHAQPLFDVFISSAFDIFFLCYIDCCSSTVYNVSVDVSAIIVDRLLSHPRIYFCILCKQWCMFSSNCRSGSKKCESPASWYMGTCITV